MRGSVALVVAIVALSAPRPAGAQTAEVVGAVGGAAAGVVVTLGWIVEQATFEEKYVHAATDLISLTGTPLVIGPAAGVALAVTDDELLGSVGAGAGAGTLLGAAAGVGLGHLLAGDRTGRWAGGMMGAAVGLLAGAAIGAALHEDSDDRAPGSPNAVRIPVGFSLAL